MAGPSSRSLPLTQLRVFPAPARPCAPRWARRLIRFPGVPTPPPPPPSRPARCSRRGLLGGGASRRARGSGDAARSANPAARTAQGLGQALQPERPLTCSGQLCPRKRARSGASSPGWEAKRLRPLPPRRTIGSLRDPHRRGGRRTHEPGGGPAPPPAQRVTASAPSRGEAGRGRGWRGGARVRPTLCKRRLPIGCGGGRRLQFEESVVTRAPSLVRTENRAEPRLVAAL